MIGIQGHIAIAVCTDSEDATRRGYTYTRDEYKPAQLDKAVIVLDGTVEHRSTVDLIFMDESGQKHVVLVTGRLLQAIAKASENAQ